MSCCLNLCSLKTKENPLQQQGLWTTQNVVHNHQSLKCQLSSLKTFTVHLLYLLSSLIVFSCFSYEYMRLSSCFLGSKILPACPSRESNLQLSIFLSYSKQYNAGVFNSGPQKYIPAVRKNLLRVDRCVTGEAGGFFGLQ